MAGSSDSYIKSSIAFSGDVPYRKTNAPSEYADQQKQYFANRTRQFIAERGYLSSDFVQAEVQGIGKCFFDYVKTKIRFSDLTRPSASNSKREDDFKEILFTDPRISYIPLGAKIKTMGNTWLVTNPSNVCSVGTTAVVTRCNASYNSYDEYGNIVKEPIHVEKASMLGNDDITKQNLVLLDGYYNIICQLNENTEKLGHNQRIILGSMAYHITGFTDFIQEFVSDTRITKDEILSTTVEVNVDTGELIHSVPYGYQGSKLRIGGGDKDVLIQIPQKDQIAADLSIQGQTLYAQAGIAQNEVRLITFTARLEEPTIADDTTDEYVANANNTVYFATISGSNEVTIGRESILSAALILNDNEVTPTQDNPISWNWFSSDTSVATVDPSGMVTGVGIGTCKIFASLTQNSEIIASKEITCTAQGEAGYVSRFVGFTDTSIKQYDTESYTVSVFLDGVEQEDWGEASWSFEGASSEDYTAVINGNTVFITCNSASDIPLTVTAQLPSGIPSVSIQINLEGY